MSLDGGGMVLGDICGWPAALGCFCEVSLADVLGDAFGCDFGDVFSLGISLRDVFVWNVALGYAFQDDFG